MFRISFGSISCGNTEDMVGDDEIYFVGSVTIISPDKKYVKIIGFNTKPVDINNGEHKTIKELSVSSNSVPGNSQSDDKKMHNGIIFEDNIPEGSTIAYNFSMYDDDVAGSIWEKGIGIAASIASGPTVAKAAKILLTTQPEAWVIAAASIGVAAGIKFLASLDKPDKLGTASGLHTVHSNYVKGDTHHFKKKGKIWNPGISTWDYHIPLTIQMD